jgi:DNA-binding LacI/PurR family transcriptional regulator
MQALAEHLIERGHRRIGFIAASVPWPSIEQRHLGYREALEGAGISPDLELELIQGGGFDESGGQSMTEMLLSRQTPPTAIMAASDLLAAGAMAAVREQGLRVPDDVAITGFNDFSFARLLDPPLTTVEVPGYNVGVTAAEILIDQLEGGTAHSRSITLPVSPRFRGSS